MPKSRTDSEWIDGFLRKELSDKDVVIFKERLAQENSFAALFKEQQLLAEGIRLSMLSNKVNHFQQLGQEIDGDLLDEQTIGEAVRYDKNLAVLDRLKEKGKVLDQKLVVKHSNTKKRWSIAASLLFLVGLSWYLLLFNSKSKHELLAEKYNQPYPAFGISKGNTENLHKNQEQGLQLYTSKKYAKALPFLKKSFKSNKYNENSLYISVCYLKTNQLDSAYTYLKKTPILVSELTDATTWYLAIYYLKKGDTQNCLENLDLLMKSNSLEFQRKAIALKNELMLLQVSKN